MSQDREVTFVKRAKEMIKQVLKNRKEGDLWSLEGYKQKVGNNCSVTELGKIS